jgi:hypothetical protein
MIYNADKTWGSNLKISENFRQKTKSFIKEICCLLAKVFIILKFSFRIENPVKKKKIQQYFANLINLIHFIAND